MNDSDIPIDIHTNKLLDWLISRRHVQRDWHSKVLKIREKINDAIKDMPENEEITVLLSGSYINYFHCLKLIEILRETESDTKNLFGHYSSKRMKDWLEIEKLYSKDNIYLGEAASLLLRNINYEIPAIRKQVTKTINNRNEYNRKEAEYEKLANTNRKEFIAICKSLDIKGEKIKKELIEKAANFPEMNKNLAQAATTLKEAVEFYQQTVHSIVNSDEKVLKMLRYVIENGDTTVYEWKYGRPPTSIEDIKFNFTEDENDQIDDTIDFGIDLDLNNDESIDWGISTEDTVTTETVPSEMDNTEARGEEARTILDNRNTRNCFLNDLLELEGFLKMRLFEMNSESNDFSVAACPEVMQLFSITSVQKMLDYVQEVLRNLRDPTAMHFLNIRTNPRYVYQLAEKLENKMRTVEKMLASRDFIRHEKEEIETVLESLNPKVELLICKSKELQALIEEDISKKYNGRPVNLIAGANLL